ncbi:MAG: hypothetical protein H0W71_09575 [Sphingomonas sp.]|nr:hypothetical protein [Sphingomonas sp.]
MPLLLLSACRTSGDLVEDQRGVYAVRNACPVAGIPAATGDITLFGPAGPADSRSIDVTASISEVQATCLDSGTELVSTATFLVLGLRTDATQARQVVLPYFDVALQGGQTVVAKQVGQIVLDFPAGSLRASARVRATVRVSRAAATLPENVRRELTRERKPGGADAAVDPLSDPAIRSAVALATFEHLIGFQLSEDQLRYNATR